MKTNLEFNRNESEMVAQVQLRLLGTPQIRYRGKKVYIGRVKGLALLIYLAVTRETHKRDVLAYLLWEEDKSIDHRAALRRLIFDLRQNLPVGCLTIEQNMIRTNEYLVTDIEAFQTLFSKYQSHSHSLYDVCEHCLDNLKYAISLYHDNFLGSFDANISLDFESWQMIQTEILRKSLFEMYQVVLETLIREGAFDEALKYGINWLRIDSLNEKIYKYLLLLYAWLGQKSKVVDIYQELLHVLREEIGDVPSTELSTLYDQIISDTIPSPIAVFEPTPAIIADNVSFEGLLSQRTTSFIGREQELQDLLDLVLNNKFRLLTIVGMGGIGKTRLVEEFLREYSSKANQPIYFRELNKNPLESEVVVGPALLVLDGFDSSVHTVEWLDQYLEKDSQLKFLLTARQRIGSISETVYRLQGLSCPNIDTGGSAEDYPAVQLFVEIVKQANTYFPIKGDVYQSIGNICSYLGGVPLAIEMIAPLTRLLDYATIYDELIDHTDTLYHTSHYPILKHQNFIAILEETWRNLEEEEQDALLSLISQDQKTTISLGIQYALMEKFSLDKSLTLPPFWKQFIMDNKS